MCQVIDNNSSFDNVGCAKAQPTLLNDELLSITWHIIVMISYDNRSYLPISKTI